MEVRALLREGALCEDSKSAALCRSLLQHEPALWTFVHKEGVECTNNFAERALRPVVLWRKGSCNLQPSAISLALLQEECRHFVTSCFFSLQPRFAQGGKMAL
jgi:hypothetical protein